MWKLESKTPELLMRIIEAITNDVTKPKQVTDKMHLEIQKVL